MDWKWHQAPESTYLFQNAGSTKSGLCWVSDPQWIIRFISNFRCWTSKKSVSTWLCRRGLSWDGLGAPGWRDLWVLIHQETHTGWNPLAGGGGGEDLNFRELQKVKRENKKWGTSGTSYNAIHHQWWVGLSSWLWDFLFLLEIVKKLRMQILVQTFAWSLGRLLPNFSTPMVGSWWGQLRVVAAGSHCHWQSRWWSDALWHSQCYMTTFILGQNIITLPSKDFLWRFFSPMFIAALVWYQLLNILAWSPYSFLFRTFILPQSQCWFQHWNLWLVWGRSIPGIETAFTLVWALYYIKFLLGWYWYKVRLVCLMSYQSSKVLWYLFIDQTIPV